MTHSLKEKIQEKKATVVVVGLGYVGLSILEAFAKAEFPILGYDCNKQKVEMLENGKSYLSYLPLKTLFTCVDEKKGVFSADPNILDKGDIFIITVPTSLDKHRLPELCNVRNASEEIVKHLKKDQLVIVQSTSYPGTTEEQVLPILQKSGLQVGKDFHLAFIPEISDIGNLQFSFMQIPKIIGGVTHSCYEMAKLLYTHVCADIYHCSSPRVAEAAKILQNTYRLVNVSFINEMKIAFDRMGIDIWEVIEAASKKPFGFTPFYPGPGIGGDCIPVDPYYLVWKARETDGPTSLIERAGEINAEIPHYVIEKTKDALSIDHKGLADSKILILGVAFKKEVDDIRESAALKILTLLEQANAIVAYHDPYVPQLFPSSRYPNLHMQSISLDYPKLGEFDCVLILTDHSKYDWKSILQYSKRIVDTHNVMAHLDGAKEKVTKA